MDHLTGNALERRGKDIFEGMGLVCANPLNQVQLNQLDPTGPFHNDEHLEFDYLIPCGNTCIVGEITSRRGINDIKTKYDKYRRNLDLLASQNLGLARFWTLLGVPNEKIRFFRNVDHLIGIFIVTELPRFDIPLPRVPNVVCFYKSEWELLTNYVNSIGKYTQHLFIDQLNIRNRETRRPLEIREDMHRLIRTQDKKITSGDIGTADVYCFEASPYELLPYACVYIRV